MRRLLSIGLLVLFAACSSDAISGAISNTGTIKFTRDASTCAGATIFTFEFFADGVSLGSAPLSAGASQSYSVAAGSHTFGTRIPNTTLIFQTINGTVAAGGTFTYTIVCQ